MRLKCDSNVIQTCFKSVSNAFKMCFQYLYTLFTPYLQCFSGVFTLCSYCVSTVFKSGQNVLTLGLLCVKVCSKCVESVLKCLENSFEVLISSAASKYRQKVSKSLNHVFPLPKSTRAMSIPGRVWVITRQSSWTQAVYPGYRNTSFTCAKERS